MLKLLTVVLAPVRLVLAALILFYDRAFSPKPLERAPARQAEVDARTKGWVLYHFEACPFCVKVRRHVRRLGLRGIEFRDVKREPRYEKELLEGGGEYQVPCLRIPGAGEGGEDRWMYESSDINAFLSERFESQ